ncbi:hypothetical protein [Brevundimonas denitrificans]|uniref:hypothetical protein n=1 Tax=Brevundimonas denitrificans TaxID=1443434 RepID=UPI00223ACB2C|nr:hypothetical protein [Brevundimonas denitrificans]
MIAHLSDVSWTRAADLGVDALVHMMPVSPDLLPPDRREAYVASRRQGAFAFFEWYEAVDLDAPEIETMIRTLAREQVHVDATLVALKRPSGVTMRPSSPGTQTCSIRTCRRTGARSSALIWAGPPRTMRAPGRCGPRCWS